MKTARVVSELEFNLRIKEALASGYEENDCVTGKGRSGAIAAVYASHILKIPFIPYGHKPAKLTKILLIDTATESGETLKKMLRFYSDYNPTTLAIYHEPPRVRFWYESKMPQFKKRA